MHLFQHHYKVAAKAIAHRIQKHLPHLIHPDQTGYVKGRYIGENIRLIDDLIQYTSLRKLPGLILLIDFEKALDSLEWSFLYKTIKFYNFGNSVLKWVKLFNTDTQSCVTNNGYATEFFKLSRSVRQGCPLAPFLFILAAEVLSLAIRGNKDIKGIMFGDCEVKLSQLADDTSCFVSDILSAKIILETLDYFAHIWGLKCNLDKTEVLWIGSRIGDEDGDLPVRWSHNSFSCLGMTFFIQNNLDTINFNITKRLEKCKETMKVWKTRKLSYIGKNVVLKTLVLSNLLYPTSLTGVDSKMAASIQKEITNFVWDKKTPKVANDVMYQPIKNGGIKLIHFPTQSKSLSLLWVVRLFKDTKSNWTVTFQSFITGIKLQDLFYSRCDHIPDRNTLPPFYLSLVNNWKDFRACYPPLSPMEILKEMLWLNPFIHHNGRSLFYKHWYRAGIKYMSDIIDNQGNFISADDIFVKFNISTNFLEYLALRLSIPINWRQQLTPETVQAQQDPLLEFLVDGKTKTIVEMKCKNFYWTMISKDFVREPAAIARWSECFTLSKSNWQDIFALAFNCSIETKLQSFQFSVLHRFVPYKSKLFKMKLVTEAKSLSRIGQ